MVTLGLLSHFSRQVVCWPGADCRDPDSGHGLLLTQMNALTKTRTRNGLGCAGPQLELVPGLAGLEVIPLNMIDAMFDFESLFKDSAIVHSALHRAFQ
jgi:hypothetical protein